MKLLLKKRQLRILLSCVCSVNVSSGVRGSEKVYFVDIEFCLKHTHLGTVCVCLAWSSLLLRCCRCVELLVLRYSMLVLSSETGNWRSTKLEHLSKSNHWSQNNGSVSFEMSFGAHEGCSGIPRWNGEALEAFELRVELFMFSTKKEDTCVVLDLSTFDPEENTFRYVRDNLSDLPLEAADGSGARMTVKIVRPMFVPSQLRKVFACCWNSSDSILCDETMVNP